jgi:hypothetical protein
MRINTYLPLQSALQAGIPIVLALALFFLVQAIVGWRGLYRKKRLIRLAFCLLAAPRHADDVELEAMLPDQWAAANPQHGRIASSSTCGVSLKAEQCSLSLN